MDKQEEYSGNSCFSRRELILAVLSGVIGAAPKGTEKQLFEVVAALGKVAKQEVKIRPEAQKRAIDLFFPETEFELIPARDHPTLPLGPREITYPNQMRVMEVIRGLFGTAKMIVPSAYQASSDRDWVVIGSSGANKVARHILGKTTSPRFRHVGRGFSVEFPYSVARMDATRSIRGFQASIDYDSESVGIVDRDRNILAVPRTKQDYVTEDFLLVTKIPGTLGRSDIVVFAGLHSPAIFAIENLISNPNGRDLDSLHEVLKGKRYFQAVFRIPSVHEKSGSLVPGETRLEISIPPVVLRPRRSAR